MELLACRCATHVVLRHARTQACHRRTFTVHFGRANAGCRPGRPSAGHWKTHPSKVGRERSGATELSGRSIPSMAQPRRLGLDRAAVGPSQGAESNLVPSTRDGVPVTRRLDLQLCHWAESCAPMARSLGTEIARRPHALQHPALGVAREGAGCATPKAVNSLWTGAARACQRISHPRKGNLM